MAPAECPATLDGSRRLFAARSHGFSRLGNSLFVSSGATSCGVTIFLQRPLCLSTGKPPSYRVMVQAQKAGRQHCSGPSYDSVIRRARTDWLVETLLT
jgi:hypothetical protein